MIFISTRYFIILVDNKENAKYIYSLIEKFLWNKLRLKLNPKSKYFPKNLGCSFLGYHIYENYILIKSSNKKSIYKKIKIWNKLYDLGILDEVKFILSYNSCKGYIKHANSYCLMNNINSRIKYFEK